MGLPNAPMFVPLPPLCRNCLIEIDSDGFCSCCGVLNAAAAVQCLEVINGDRGESFEGSSAPAAEGA